MLDPMPDGAVIAGTAAAAICTFKRRLAEKVQTLPKIGREPIFSFDGPIVLVCRPYRVWECPFIGALPATAAASTSKTHFGSFEDILLILWGQIAVRN